MQGERVTATTCLLHQLAVAPSEARGSAVPLFDWLLQHRDVPAPDGGPAFQHLCFALALDHTLLPQVRVRGGGGGHRPADWIGRA